MQSELLLLLAEADPRDTARRGLSLFVVLLALGILLILGAVAAALLRRPRFRPKAPRHKPTPDPWTESARRVQTPDADDLNRQRAEQDALELDDTRLFHGPTPDDFTNDRDEDDPDSFRTPNTPPDDRPSGPGPRGPGSKGPRR